MFVPPFHHPPQLFIGFQDIHTRLPISVFLFLWEIHLHQRYPPPPFHRCIPTTLHIHLQFHVFLARHQRDLKTFLRQYYSANILKIVLSLQTQVFPMSQECNAFQYLIVFVYVNIEKQRYKSLTTDPILLLRVLLLYMNLIIVYFRMVMRYDEMYCIVGCYSFVLPSYLIGHSER